MSHLYLREFLRLNEYERMFEEDIRDKKRIGRGIFSRKATRKGGTRTPLKTPYYYMTKREKQALNGKVKVYCMEDIISYEDFIVKDPSDQIRLMSLWKKSYKKVYIHQEMGVSSSTFYRLLERLEKLNSDNDAIGGGIVVAGKPTGEKLEKFKESMISYEEFRSQPNTEKNRIVENYVQFFGSVAELSRNWESSDIAYLYSVHQRVKKRREKQEKLAKEQRAKEAKERRQAERASEDKYKDLRQAMDSMPEKPSDNTSDIVKAITSNETEPEKHDSNMNISTETLSLALNGKYDGEGIARLLSLASEVISKSSGKLKIELKITQEEG